MDSPDDSIGSGGMARFNPLLEMGRQPAPRVDRFGLPLGWRFRLETFEQRVERMALAINLVREVFSVASDHLGDSFAKEIWKKTAKGKAGRPKGRRKSPEDDAMILQWHDDAALKCDEKGRKSLPRKMAVILKKDDPNKYPSTESSIETRIRRLLRDREKEREASSKADREWASSLLGDYFLTEGAAEMGALSLGLSGNALARISRGALARYAPDKKST